MERFSYYLFQDQLGCTEALEKAQYEVRDLTIGQIRSEWLTPEAIAWVESRSNPLGEHLRSFKSKSG